MLWEAFTDIRVDFEGWRDLGGAKLPFEVTHSTSGGLDFRIMLNEIKLNQPIVGGQHVPDSVSPAMAAPTRSCSLVAPGETLMIRRFDIASGYRRQS